MMRGLALSKQNKYSRRQVNKERLKVSIRIRLKSENIVDFGQMYD